MNNNEYPEREEEILPEGGETLLPEQEEWDLPDPAEEFPAEEPASPEEIPVSEEIPVTAEAPVTEQILPEEAPAAEAAQPELPYDMDEEIPIDLSILNDPEFAAASAEAAPTVTEEAFRDEAFSEAFGNGEEFNQIYEESVKENEAAAKARTPRKGRPRRKKGEILFGLPQIAVTCVWLALILVIGVTMGRMLWVCAADVLAFGREDQVVTITVYESDTIEDVTEKLHKGGLIRYPGLFRLYADLAVEEGEIKPGIWDLNTMYDYHALVNMMSPSSNLEVVEDVLIPEGFTCRQIFELLEEKRVCTAKDLADYAASGELDEYWFLEGVERGYEYCLEGYLFPDTYDFYKNSSPREVLEKMLSNFDYRFSEEMKAQLDVLNANVTGGTFTAQDVVIVASMIEKETAGATESPLIASVIYNRLFRWGNTPAFLNIDASIVYALDGKTDLTLADLQVESPYNTYTHIGLTPGPISNPGLSSLQAALSPAESNYYYYVLNPATGKHQFSTTLEEHEGYRAQFAAAAEG